MNYHDFDSISAKRISSLNSLSLKDNSIVLSHNRIESPFYNFLNVTNPVIVYNPKFPKEYADSRPITVSTLKQFAKDNDLVYKDRLDIETAEGDGYRALLQSHNDEAKEADVRIVKLERQVADLKLQTVPTNMNITGKLTYRGKKVATNEELCQLKDTIEALNKRLNEMETLNSSTLRMMGPFVKFKLLGKRQHFDFHALFNGHIVRMLYDNGLVKPSSIPEHVKTKFWQARGVHGKPCKFNVQVNLLLPADITAHETTDSDKVFEIIADNSLEYDLDDSTPLILETPGPKLENSFVTYDESLDIESTDSEEDLAKQDREPEPEIMTWSEYDKELIHTIPDITVDGIHYQRRVIRINDSLYYLLCHCKVIGGIQDYYKAFDFPNKKDLLIDESHIIASHNVETRSDEVRFFVDLDVKKIEYTSNGLFDENHLNSLFKVDFVVYGSLRN